MNRAIGLLCLLPTLLLSACAVGEADPELDKGEAEPINLQVSELGERDANSPYQGELALNELTTASLTRFLPYHLWTFNLLESSDVFVDLANREGRDTYLYLYEWSNGAWQLMAANDDCGDSLNSCWEGSLDAGKYAVLATSYRYAVYHAREGFTYDLTVWAEPSLPACGSRGLAPCPAGFYCDWDNSTAASACGAADIPGVCREVPHVCPLHYAPMCGCDGQTYSNECFAARSGVDVAHSGKCLDSGQQQGETCGGIATLQCAPGLVCDYSANTGCNIADVGGVCVTADETLCPEIYAPVCGCDGVTYSNDCYRRAALVALDHDGTCEPAGHGEGEICGGIAGFVCAEGLRCDFSQVASCQIVDAAGTCVTDEPTSCTAVYQPVCGCNGTTYSNDCYRRAAGAPLDHIGACSP